MATQYAMHWPYKQLKTSRNQKLLPYHQHLKDKGACFGEVAGFERPMWYALNGKKPRNMNIVMVTKIGMSLLNMKQLIQENNVGFFDLSTFAKFEIQGEEAFSSLQYLCSNNIKRFTRIHNIYTNAEQHKGGIEADLTITCIEKNKFRIITGSSVREHDKKHIRKFLNKKIKFTDITDNYSCFGIFGPNSRKLSN